MSETDTPHLPSIQFIDWNQPFLPSFVAHLMSEYGTDLAGKIIVVPTAESGRRLRHALAKHGCVLAPKVVTPQFFLAQKSNGQELASLYGWVHVLMDLDLDQARGLFPKDPPDGVLKGFRWAFNVGKQLHELASNLAETNKDFAEVGRMSAGGLDGDRWSDLAMLAEQVEQTLRSWKVTETDEYQQIDSDSEIIIAAVADLGATSISRLTQLIHNGANIHVLIHGDQKMPHAFDDWGRPEPSVWLEEPIPYPDWKKNILICEKPSLLGEQVVAKISTNQWLPEDISLGLCDRELAAPVTRELAEAGWDVYDPEGKQIKSSSLMQFLRALRSWLTEDRPLTALLDLLRLPQMDAFLRDESPSRYAMIKEIEQLVARRLVSSSHDLIEYNNALPIPSKSLISLQNLLTDTEQIYQGSAVKGLRGWVARALNRSPESAASTVVDDISAMFNVLEKIEKKTKKVDLEQALDLICEVLSNRKMYADPSGTMIDLKGWIELMYEDAPELLLLGLHEGTVPASGGDDPFLPDSMREMLGLETSRDHYARDCYLFRSLLESRKNVYTYLTKLNESNVPNAASRLLLRSSGKDLAERVQRFFGESDVVPENPSAWQRDWSLTLPEVKNPYTPVAGEDNLRMLSPTALRDYLHCPLRFFLKRVLRMERFSPDKTEMDALDFGNLVHAVVEKFGLDESVRDSTKESEIAAAFESILDKEVFFRFGKNLHLAVQIQVQIASNRLRALARIQAQERAKGWKIIDVELKIGKDLPWTINGHPMTMMLDRVERHEQTGEIRVMDYKTSAKAKPPRDAHLETFKEEENKPILGELVPSGKRELRWSNLQLPIYAWFAQQHYKCEEIPIVGYIQLPNAVSDTAFTEWEKFDQPLLDSAKLWAEETVNRIQKSDFYTPANLSTKEQGWDDYAKLAQGDIAEAFGL